MSEDTLYWSGGTDCGIPDCVEHAYMKNKAKLGDVDGGLAQESRMNEIEADTWRCVRMVLDRADGKGELRLGVLTKAQLLAENRRYEGFAADVICTVDAGEIYDDSDQEIGGITVMYLPFGKITVDGGGAIPLCEHNRPVRCSHE